MRILYVILTCDKFTERRKLQNETWVKYIGNNDKVIYLNSINNGDENYENVPIKYSEFIKECETFMFFDWVFFCDDDTFVFPKKLSHLLRYFDKQEPIMIGRTGVYAGYTVCSGGAGFAVSLDLIIKVKKFVLNNNYYHLPNSDTSFGMWAKLSCSDLKIIDRADQFQTQHLRHDDNSFVDIDSVITFHYCGNYDFKVLSKYLRYAV